MADPTGAWIDHLRLLGVYERPIRIQALSRGELEAVALRLLANDPKRYKAQFEALLAKVDQVLNQLGEAAVVAHETLEAELLDTRWTLAMNTEERDIDRCNRIETEKRIAELEDKYAGASATIERLEGERSVRTGRIAELEDKLMRAQFDVYPPGKVSRIARLEEALQKAEHELESVDPAPGSAFDEVLQAIREALADKGEG